jgi:hypothetical protein
MKHNITGSITASQEIRDEVSNLFNSIDQQQLWLEEYFLADDGIAVNFHICFYTESNRDNVLASLNGLQGILINCELGSYYRKILSDHDLPKEQRTGSIIVAEWTNGN